MTAPPKNPNDEEREGEKGQEKDADLWGNFEIEKFTMTPVMRENPLHMPQV